jgi:hypothetical protein
VTIPEYVKSISNSTFQDCTSLTAVTIPKRVDYIGDSAFQGCNSLQKIIIYCYFPPSLCHNAFSNTGNCNIYVPSESVERYKNEWSYYSSRIYGM